MNVSVWFRSETWDLSPEAWVLVGTTAIAATLLFVGASASGGAAALIVIAPLVLLLAKRRRPKLEPVGPTTVVAVACWAYACTSLLWAADADFGIRALLVSASVIAAVHISRSVHAALPEEWLKHMTRTVVVVFVLFATYGLIEEALNHPIKRFVFWPFQAFQLVGGWPRWDWDHISRVRATRANWNIANMSLMLWPVLLMLRAHVDEAQQRWMVPALVALTLVMALCSNHQTSIVALTAAVFTFGIAHLSIKAAALMAGAGWILAVILMVPVTHWAYQQKLHLVPAVPLTLQHRIVIWGYTAEQITKRPLLGVGVGSTEPLDDARPDAERFKRIDGTVFHARTGGHPHNFYLQVLYEFGALGGALFLGLGLVIVWCASRLSNPYAAHNLAAFVGAAAMSSATFGLFELWYVGTLAMVAVLLSMATVYANRLNNKSA